MDYVKKELPKAKQYEGMSQYRPPLSYELVGRSIELVMDSGYDYELIFKNRKTLTYGLLNGEKKEYAYDCLKADDDTYFVNLEMLDNPEHTVYTFVLDLEQSLVTAVTATIYLNPKVPKLPYTDIVFGAIRKEDGSIPAIRHGYTTDMIGKAICWRYGTLTVIHVYSSERYYRLTMLPEDMERMRAANPDRPEGFFDGPRVYEEPSDYIKIKDGVYVFNMIESMMARGERKQGNNLLFLMNLNRMYDVGRSYGHNGEGNLENYTYGAYGAYYDASDILAKKSTGYIR
jgi:hypothetical protein